MRQILANRSPTFTLNTHIIKEELFLWPKLLGNIMPVLLLPGYADAWHGRCLCCWKDHMCFNYSERWQADQKPHLGVICSLTDQNNEMLVRIGGRNLSIYWVLCSSLSWGQWKKGGSLKSQKSNHLCLQDVFQVSRETVSSTSPQIEWTLIRGQQKPVKGKSRATDDHS